MKKNRCRFITDGEELKNSQELELGYTYSIVLGSEKYYPRVGYLPAKNLGISPSFDVPSENFMAYRLREDVPNICGILKYAKEFGIE